MGLSNAMKLVLLLTLFTIATTLAIQIASESGPDSDVGIPSKNISSPGGERSLLQRMLKGKHHKKGRRHRGRRPRLAAEKPVGNAAAVVAQDGSGNFPNIKAALDASLKRGGNGRFVIHIKSGVYSEHVVVTEAMKNVMFTGDGMGKTIITGSLSIISGDRGTSESATVIIKGDGFVARDITFRNTAGPEKHQAPAITSSAPHSAFFRCGFEGYQDTIDAVRGQQFFKECDIYGTVDFICGDAAAIFQDCNLRLRRSPGRTITIAASSRNLASSPTGFVFQHCRVTAEPELSQVIGTHKIYLGRPWKSFARTIYIQNDFDVPVQAQGWMPWETRSDGGDANTVYYREYGNRGIGSSTGGRVKWPGYRVMDSNEASQFTVANLIQGHTWLPSTGVPFNPALFTIATALAIEFASSSADSNDPTPSRTVLSPEGERRLLQQMLRGRRRRGIRPRGQAGMRRAGRRRGRRAPVIVAQDGSGNFQTIKAALDASLRRKGVGRFVIHIKAGVYREVVVVDERMKNIRFTGDGIGRTIITGSNFEGGNFGAWNSTTVLVQGDGFVARDLTFQNTYRYKPAPAITIEAPQSAFYRVGFDGYQDTILLRGTGRQFFKECDVYGTVDFICGDGNSIFQNSNIIARKSFTGNEITITASRRGVTNLSTGLVFQNCRVTAMPDLREAFGSTKIYLGRPWGDHARTIFMNCDFDLPIHPEGWLAWEGSSPVLRTNPPVDYREFGNRGMGSLTRGRVRWAGYRVMTDRNEANQFTVANFIQGQTWLPRTGVPFFLDL
ncbi:hypothetical protein RHMOL_Rhmol03G0194100 [Rhododendron molle]|uniref:Uncharacterized protein n=1 Tax=Rhododendron molle TaxID=49168 RepID=A0ACC0PGB0_RHOML|nr:hypothetical protein RHMOL_Rhmol03G0194100 [Rhododendron molle]